ncbi:Uncharacterised protein [Mycobacteroides abscessus subsp. abscessus]|nr:Uncharacterised protein [Mycobacteroides abscessus subsp. abscessus]
MRGSNTWISPSSRVLAWDRIIVLPNAIAMAVLGKISRSRSRVSRSTCAPLSRM